MNVLVLKSFLLMKNIFKLANINIVYFARELISLCILGCTFNSPKTLPTEYSRGLRISQLETKADNPHMEHLVRILVPDAVDKCVSCVKSSINRSIS